MLRSFQLLSSITTVETSLPSLVSTYQKRSLPDFSKANWDHVFGTDRVFFSSSLSHKIALICANVFTNETALAQLMHHYIFSDNPHIQRVYDLQSVCMFGVQHFRCVCVLLTFHLYSLLFDTTGKYCAALQRVSKEVRYTSCQTTLFVKVQDFGDNELCRCRPLYSVKS